MHKFDPNITPIVVAAVLAVSLGYAVTNLTNIRDGSGIQIAQPAHAEVAGEPQGQWAASATGRVEPNNGEVRVSSQVPGRIVEVLAKTNDQVKDGDLLIRLDDQEIYTRLAAAASEVSVRVRERDEEQVQGPAVDRRKAEDAVASAERALFAAREAFDTTACNVAAGTAKGDALEADRKKVTEAENKVAEQRAALHTVNARADMPLYLRLEASLSSARAELSGAEIALERTRIRAPANGTVLNMIAKVGEAAAPSPESALLVFGDLSSLRLRAEVEERDAAKVSVGQKVVVKADAFPDKTFEGKVTSISQSLGAPRIATRGPRRPNDVEVVEVMVALDGNPPLFTGMRVDAFFARADSASTAAAVPKTN